MKQTMTREHELAERVEVYRETLIAVAKERNKTEQRLAETMQKLATSNRLLNYYYTRYHETREGLISNRLTENALRKLLSDPSKPLDDKGFGLDISDDDLAV